MKRPFRRRRKHELDEPEPVADLDEVEEPELAEADQSDEAEQELEPEPVADLDELEEPELDEAEPDEAEQELEPEPDEQVKGKFRSRMSTARGNLSGFLSSVVSRKVDDSTWDELEEALILADAGVGTTTALIDRLKEQAKQEKVTDPEVLLTMLKAQVAEDLGGRDLSMKAGGAPSVWLFVGVNGVGKTTTIGKLAARETHNGASVVLAAGDTFRAAAAEQLGQWADRAGAELIRGADGADPSSVIFDAIEHAAATDASLVMADTAGRLHTRTNLMEELAKIHRVAGKGPGTVTEVLLVIDSSTGQNGLAQARRFTESAELTGVVLTKLDGSARGGIVMAVQNELDIPVKLVGLGEGIDDLVEFDAAEFADALFS